MNLRTTPRCKHGMIPEWCAYCKQPPIKTIAKSTGRGIGRMGMMDPRPMMIWHKPQEEAT